jgi:hypothetical protein
MDDNSTAGSVIRHPREDSHERDAGSKNKGSALPFTKPFSGHGYCLGSALDESDMMISTAHAENVKGIKNKQTGYHRNINQSGLKGGMWSGVTGSSTSEGSNMSHLDEEVEESGERDADQSLHHTDFVNSQDENDVMEKVTGFCT